MEKTTTRNNAVRLSDTAERIYNSAISRLSSAEQQRERKQKNSEDARNNVIPYNMSLYFLTGKIADIGMDQGWLSPESGLPNGRIMAAVSGGGDSVALLWILKTLFPNHVTAAHVNHGIRGRCSDDDAAFVTALAQSWEIPSVIRSVNVPANKLRGESTETAARRMRHAALNDMADECEASWIALGHNMDDRAETALFNIIRGTGARGAAGMPDRRERIIRPLIYMRRQFLRDILAIRGISWREDASNGDTAYTRNFIRLKLMPFIEENINVRAAEHIAAFAEEMTVRREDDEVRGEQLLDDISVTDVLSAARCECRGRETHKADFIPVLTISRKMFRGMTKLQRELILREAGRRLGLPADSRSGTCGLAQLIAGTTPFTYNWCRRALVRSERGGKAVWEVSSDGGEHVRNK